MIVSAQTKGACSAHSPTDMKLSLAWFSLLAVLVFGLAAPPAHAAEAAAGKAPGSSLATAFTTVTGIAISPLLGTGAYGAYQWIKADSKDRASLPWYAQWTFWVPALILVGLVAFKDAFGAVIPPGLKKPFDVLETVENKVVGLVAAGAVVPLTMSSLSKLLVAHVSTGTHGAALPGLAMIQLGAIDFSWLLNVLTIPFGIAVFAIVWMASHAITVLILLSPWGAIDAVLKGARTALLGLLTLTATLNPWVAAAMSLVVLIVAYLVAGWAFRLTVFGTIFSWDFFTLRRTRFHLAADNNKLFAGGNLPKVPTRTYGRLRKAESGCVFAYKPWLVMAEKTVPVPVEGLAVGRGLFFSTVLKDEKDTYFLLPPRYRGHEDQLARCYQLPGGVKPAGLRRAWGAVRELFGGAAARTQMV